ncbi:MAG: LysM peptidoglycan-binding domain-containing protein [Prevotella sp.]|nr:LysM peptidoglycan-binding domain-containing protein [Prevotella sp.]
MRKVLRYMLLALLLGYVSSATAQVNKWRDMYKAKKKDTIFGIAKKYGVTIPELMNANPEMKAEGYELKKGDYVFIPFPSATSAASAPASSSTPAAVSGEQQGKTIRVGVMLPLHDVDGDGRRMVEYYRGFLMGCDSLRAAGISTDIRAWNVNIDADIAQVLKDPAAAHCDIIFGPLYSHQVRGLAEFCKARNIKMVIPFSINGDDVASYQQIFQVWESPDKLNNSAIDAFMQRFPNAHPVFIDCNDKDSKKGVFTFGLRNRLSNKNMEYSVTNISGSEEVFAKAFSKTKRNVVILNTGRSPELTVALAKLESLQNNQPSLAISLFGYTEWLMYTANNLDKFFRFDTYIPASFYYNEVDPRTQRLEQNYSRWFRQDMQYALPRFAITGYDHAQFFLRGIDKHGKKFKGTKGQSTYTAMQSPLVFKQVSSAGMQNEFFHLIHYTKDERIESIAY